MTSIHSTANSPSLQENTTSYESNSLEDASNSPAYIPFEEYAISYNPSTWISEAPQKYFFAAYDNDEVKIPDVLEVLYQESLSTDEYFLTSISDWIATRFPFLSSSVMPNLEEFADLRSLERDGSSPSIMHNLEEPADLRSFEQDSSSSVIPNPEEPTDLRSLEQNGSSSVMAKPEEPMDLRSQEQDRSSSEEPSPTQPTRVRKRLTIDLENETDTARPTKRARTFRTADRNDTLKEVEEIYANLRQIGEKLNDIISPSDFSLTSNTTSRPDVAVDLVRKNYHLGILGAKVGLEGKICKCVHLMHIYHEVNMYGGGGSKTNISDGVDFVVNAISVPSITRDSVREKRRIGERYTQLRKAFGWALLLADGLSPRALRDMHKDTLEVLITGTGDGTHSYTQIKKTIDDCISPEEAKRLMIKVITKISGDIDFATSVIEDIDRD